MVVMGGTLGGGGNLISLFMGALLGFDGPPTLGGIDSSEFNFMDGDPTNLPPAVQGLIAGAATNGQGGGDPTTQSLPLNISSDTLAALDVLAPVPVNYSAMIGMDADDYPNIPDTASATFASVGMQAGFLTTPRFYFEWGGASGGIALFGTEAGGEALMQGTTAAWNVMQAISPEAATAATGAIEGWQQSEEYQLPEANGPSIMGWIGQQKLDQWGQGESDDDLVPPGWF